MAQKFWRIRFKFFQSILNCNFVKFVIYLPLKSVWPFIWTNLNPLHQRMHCARFLNFIIIISLYRNYLPLEKDVAIHLNNLEFPPSKDALSKVWLKLSQWFLRYEHVKSLQTDGQTDRDRRSTDDMRSDKLTWASINGSALYSVQFSVFQLQDYV